jgi:hypothetical protein
MECGQGDISPFTLFLWRMKKKWSTRIIDFYGSTRLQTPLPKDVEALYPFLNDKGIQRMVKGFYNKYYNDQQPRTLILGINPGRLGAGSTGIPFTDTKRLIDVCGIPCDGMHTHEPSSVFVYDAISAYGGPELFYRDFYISSICPIGFIKTAANKAVNFNYYDDKAFAQRLMPEIAEMLKQQISWGLQTDNVIIFGTGQNLNYFEQLNQHYELFKKVLPLEHPRFVMQYKQKEKQAYIDKYLDVLQQALEVKQ